MLGVVVESKEQRTIVPVATVMVMVPLTRRRTLRQQMFVRHRTVKNIDRDFTLCSTDAGGWGGATSRCYMYNSAEEMFQNCTVGVGSVDSTIGAMVVEVGFRSTSAIR